VARLVNGTKARRDWTRAEVSELRKHSKAKTRVDAAAKSLKRTPAAIRQKAYALGIPLGHRRASTGRGSRG
jgi:hypothetical protein